jgi:hypothetical protein
MYKIGDELCLSLVENPPLYKCEGIVFIAQPFVDILEKIKLLNFQFRTRVIRKNIYIKNLYCKLSNYRYISFFYTESRLLGQSYEVNVLFIERFDKKNTQAEHAYQQLLSMHVIQICTKRMVKFSAA